MANVKDEKIVNFINQVRANVELWDIRSEHYKRGDKKDTWSRIATECDFTDIIL